MSKLYVFAIGGTGSRVLRALTLVLASGVELRHGYNTVVPIIIDPDSANGDLERTTDILTKYQRIKNQIGESSGFFKTEIKTLRNLSDNNSNSVANNFLFKIAGTASQSFDSFISYHALGENSQSLMDLLYTSEDLQSSMEVGFKGKPNIGSIVLNQIIENQGYNMFANKFDEGDGIFIISSIFGGTGAAGFPLLLKNLRDEDPKIPNSHLISNSKIGAVTFLPYFKITPPAEDEEQTIDSSTFLGKAKAALHYYEHAVFRRNQLNAFYYLGDHSQNDYPHNDGKAEQKNKAHFLELAGAMAIVDFIDECPKHETQEKEAVNSVNKEFGVGEYSADMKFQHLGKNLTRQIRQSLVQLSLMEKFLEHSLGKNLDSKTTWVKDGGFGKAEFFNKDFYQREFEPFIKYYREWLREMSDNHIAFSPFQNKVNHDSLLNFINGFERKNGILKNRTSGEALTKELNRIYKKFHKGNSKESDFLELFNASTRIVAEQILNS